MTNRALTEAWVAYAVFIEAYDFTVQDGVLDGQLAPGLPITDEVHFLNEVLA